MCSRKLTPRNDYGLKFLTWDNFRFPSAPLVGYADDFIVTGHSKECLENEVKPLIADFLAVRGLTLSEEKTKVTHINDGFDFLGFNHRKYKGKLLIKPSKPNVIMFLSDLQKLIKRHRTIPVNELIRMMNPKLRGWTNYYSHSVAKQTFNYIDHRLFEIIWSWAKRRHPTKGKHWVAMKYFINRKGQWQFHGWQKVANMDCQFNLVQIARVPIKRHVKIRNNATPYNPEFADYLKKRKQPKRCRNFWSEPVTAMF